MNQESIRSKRGERPGVEIAIGHRRKGGYNLKGRLEKRSKSSWTIVIEAGRDPATGRRRRTYRAVQGNKTQAKQEMDQLLAEMQTGTYVVPVKTTLAEHLKDWLAASCAPRLAPKTIGLYTQCCDLHIIPRIGQLYLSEIEPRHVQRLYSEMLEDGAGKRMIEVTHVVLRSSLKQAAKWQMIRHNPADYASPPRHEKKRVHALKPDQIPSLVATAEGSPVENLILIALATGMRKGELLALKWRDVDLDIGVINVQRGLVRVGGETIIGPPKTKHARRAIPIDPVTMNRLQAMNAASASEFVFTRQDGMTPMDPSTVTHRFKRVAVEAGFPEICFHDLRHTHASFLLSKNVHPKAVQERLGHGSISITMDTYSHLMPTIQEGVPDTVSEMFFKWRQNGGNRPVDSKGVH